MDHPAWRSLEQTIPQNKVVLLLQPVTGSKISIGGDIYLDQRELDNSQVQAYSTLNADKGNRPEA
jgi:hypothetical protein